MLIAGTFFELNALCTEIEINNALSVPSARTGKRSTKYNHAV